jgi:HSP20 family molecular chaperone IbpA
MTIHAELDYTDDMLHEFAHVNEQLQRRGMELLRKRSRFHDHTVDDWLEAERALASQPVVEVRRAGGVVEVLADLADVDPHTVEVEATAEAILITAPRTPSTNEVYLSIRPPAAIDPATVHAAFRDGLLSVTVNVSHDPADHVRVPIAD